MGLFTLTKHVAASVSDTFALFSDFAGAAERLSGIDKIEMLTDGPIGPGTRFRETRTMFGRQATEELEIVAFEQDRSLAVRCESCGCEFITRMRFEPDGDGTKVTAETRTRALTLMAKLMSPLGWLMMGSMKKAFEKDLDELKACVERES
jgi:hypothetical protein